MFKYLTRPSQIEAFQIRGDGPTPTPAWFKPTDSFLNGEGTGVTFLFGLIDIYVNYGDYIIKNEYNEIFSMEKEIFESSHTLILN